jgi:RimJ/RimL family protein N-acetyltransferase
MVAVKREQRARAGAGASAVTVTLRDGHTVEVRPIRPDDRKPLADAFEHLSAESRYLRFLSLMPELRPSQLTYLTEVDHRDHEALVAIGPDGVGVGVARYVRVDRPDTAEAAVVVADEWQRRGVGSALLALLADRGREEGVRHFVAHVLAENTAMLDLLATLAPARQIGGEPGVVELDIPLPESGAGEALQQLLRGSARGELQVRSSRGLHADTAT